MTTSDPLAARQLQTLADALRELHADTLGIAAFSELAQRQSALLAALPPRYGEVLMQLLTRLETSARFSEESCSFSVSGLYEGLDVWMARARQQLAADRAG